MSSTLTAERALTDAELSHLHRRSMVVALAAQAVSGVGVVAGVTVGALLAQQMTDSDRLAGVPAAAFMIGSAVAAFLVARVTHSSGRRVGLSLGFAIGAIGAIGVVAAAHMENLPLLFTALFVYGFGSATNLQSRYVGTDLAPPERRASAVALAMLATMTGSVLGPLSTGFVSRAAESLGTPPLAGPFVVATIVYVLAAVLLVAFLRPDPYLVSIAQAHQRLVDAGGASDQPSGAHGTDATVTSRPSAEALAGGLILVVSHLAMIALMTMAPVHMSHHNHNLDQVGVVMGIHIAAMFLPALIVGRVVDRVGSSRTGVAAGAILLGAGLLAAVAPNDSLPGLAAAMALLGIGWNLGMVGGTTALVASVAPARRARVQGFVDALIALAGAVGGIGSGLVLGTIGFEALAVGSGGMALLSAIAAAICAGAAGRPRIRG